MSLGRLGIAGVGLIGGSIALRARAAGAAAFVAGFDSDASGLARALERGVVDAAIPTLDALAAGSDTLVIALPLDATRAALEQLVGRRGPELVIDVASVKGPLIAVGCGVPKYLGTHPMAGRERGGVDSADPALFENAVWAHLPHREPALVALTRAFIDTMGARPIEIDAGRHDAIVALTSHLPQALSVALGAELGAAMHDDPHVMELCGPGIISMLRLAHSPPTMWTPIVTANAEPLAERLRSLARALDFAAAGLEAGDSEPLMSYFKTARDAAVALEQRFAPGPRSSAYRRPYPSSRP